jgi:hypothetical protein
MSPAATTTRRGFVYGLAASGALVGWIGWRFHRGTVADAMEVVVRKCLDYLQLDPDGVTRFAQDLAARNEISAAKLRMLTVAGRLYTALPSSSHNFVLDAIRQSEERVVTIYLLSSDFFINGSDESRLVRYRGLYDALHPCSNPFARLVAV